MANQTIYPFGQLGGNSITTRQSLNVLFIGNSFSVDTVGYALKILKDLCPLKVTIGVLYQASTKLAHHVDKLNSSSNTAGLGGHLYETYYVGDTDEASWATTSNQNPDTVIASKQWDVLVLHQRSQESGDYRTVEPYMDSIINYVNNTLPNIKVGWLITQAYSESYISGTPRQDSYGNTFSTSNAMHAAIADVAGKVVEDHSVDFVVPTGTAIQILRNSSYGEPTADGYHLNVGIPVLTAGYCMALTVLEEMGIGGSVWDCGYIPTANDDPSGNGSFDVSTITDANILLAMRCAQLAQRDKFNLQSVI